MAKRVRKPHNLVTAYWDDMKNFHFESEKVESVRELYDRCYTTAISNLQEDNKLKKIIPNLPTFDRRGIRYTILSSFLFLEAFINQEYYNEIGFKNSISELTPTQKKSLDKIIIETSFEEKWSLWISDFLETGTGSIVKVKGGKEFQDLMKLKGWRNHLTHYKIHHLQFVADRIESIENSREAFRIAVQTVKWYFNLTKKDMPEWIKKELE
jgi:hypothetical protein